VNRYLHRVVLEVSAEAPELSAPFDQRIKRLSTGLSTCKNILLPIWVRAKQDAVLSAAR
jgi:hypothetical protein